MQQNTHGLVQLIRAATPDAPNQTPMPQLSKQMLNVCRIPLMHIIVRLLPGRQSSIASSNEWHNDTNPAFISTVMAPNVKIKEITTGKRRSIPIPNHNIRRCPGGQRANPFNVAQHINGKSYLVNMRRILRIPQISTPYATNGTDGHGIREMCHKEGRIGSPWWGEINMATSPLPSRGLRGGEKSIQLHCPYLLGFPMVERTEGWKIGKNG